MSVRQKSLGWQIGALGLVAVLAGASFLLVNYLGNEANELAKQAPVKAGGTDVADSNKPIIQLVGEENVIIPLGSQYVELGATAKAKDGSDLTDKVKVTGLDAKIYRPEDTRLFTIEKGALGVHKADMVLTFRNYHNFDAAGRKAMNDAAFEALREGGVYGVVDHSRRHMEDDSSENRRRFDPVKAIMEIQSAGFELLDFASLHFRADDELRYEVGRRTVSGNTDRWTLKFKKVSE